MPTDDDDIEDAPKDVFADDALIDEQEVSGAKVDDEYRSLLISEIKQRMRFRTVAVWTTIILLIFLSLYSLSAFYHVAYVDARRFLPWGGIAPSTAVVLVVAPIVAVSTITAMLLIGAFRRFKEGDSDKIDVQSLAAEAVRASMGGQ